MSGLLGRYRAAVSGRLHTTREAWPLLTLYERFEQVVSLVVTVLVSVLVVVAVVHLTWRIGRLCLVDITDPSQQEAFQAVFGVIMTVLIALEFNHSILSVLNRQHGIVQLRTVVLIALLAVVRKFVLIDVSSANALVMFGLAASALALGGVYWLVREQDRLEAAGARESLN